MRRCDGSSDCRDDSDERGCPYAEGLNLRTYPTSQNITQGRQVVFQCRDEGPIRAKVAWRRGNGLPLPPGTRDLRGRLEMPNIQMSDTGTFICYATEYSSNFPGAEISVYLLVEQSKCSDYLGIILMNFGQCNVITGLFYQIINYITHTQIYLFYDFKMLNLKTLSSSQCQN